jgi:hypothetical protein
MRKLLKLIEKNFLKYGTAALIMAVPLYPKFPLVNIPGTYVALRLEDFLIALVALFWLFSQFRQRLKFIKDDLNQTIIAYLLIGFLSLLSAILITQTVEPHIALLHTLRRVEYLIVFFIMVASIKSGRDVRFFLQVFLLTAFLVFLYGLGQKFLMFPVISTMNVEFAKGLALRLAPGARVSSTFAGHYDLAAYLVLLLPLVMAVVVASRKKIHRVLLLFFYGFLFWLLLASASRISFAAYLGAMTITLFFLKKKAWIIPVIVLSLMMSVFATELTDRYANTLRVALIRVEEINIQLPWSKKPTRIAFEPEPTPTPLPAPAVGPAVKEPVKVYRITPTPTPTPGSKRYVYYGGGGEAPPEDRSTAIRLNVEWPRAIRAFLKNPLLGTGYSSITLATDNDYLRALGEVGLFGFLAFVFIFVKIGIEARKIIFSKQSIKTDKAILIGLTGGALGFLANALFIDVFEASKVAITFWLLMGLLIGMTRVSFSKRKVK